MKIAVVGSGYVGLVTGGCLANLGNDVICVDVDQAKVDGLRNGEMPFFEPGLRDIIDLNLKQRRLMFTTDIELAVKHSEVIFIAVGTPPGEDGGADISAVLAVAADIGKNMNEYKVVVMKSTVPVGTNHRLADTIKANQPSPMEFDTVSNPEFLREGEAVNDFMNPDRVVLGVNSQKAADVMTTIYRSIERTGRPILITDVLTAELIKYASNAMLATRISFMNELACLCDKVGADVKMIAKGMGLDNRIGPRFLQAGAGYGGSCFPKDVKALIHTIEENGCKASLLQAVNEVNERQKKSIVPRLQSLLSDLSGKTVAVWGLSFKPKTDDMREAPSIVAVRALQDAGAKVVAFDPVAEKSARRLMQDVSFTQTPLEAAENADALIIMTEWDSFRELDKKKLKEVMRTPVLLDARNIYDPKEMRGIGFTYVGIGR